MTELRLIISEVRLSRSSLFLRRCDLPCSEEFSRFHWTQDFNVYGNFCTRLHLVRVRPLDNHRVGVRVVKRSVACGCFTDENLGHFVGLSTFAMFFRFCGFPRSEKFSRVSWTHYSTWYG